MKCPGQDSRYWSGDDVFETPCPRCGHILEFFKDDSQRRCSQCGHRLLNPKMDFGCASYCPYAEQCLGSLPPEMLAQRDDLFKDRLAMAVQQHLGGTNAARQATDTAALAETIGKTLADINMAHLVAAALLLRVDPEDPVEVARTILAGLQADGGLLEPVIDLIKTFHDGSSPDTAASRALHDSDLIVCLQKAYRESPPTRHQLEADLTRLLTQAGRTEAKTLLLPLTRS